MEVGNVEDHLQTLYQVIDEGLTNARCGAGVGDGNSGWRGLMES